MHSPTELECLPIKTIFEHGGTESAIEIEEEEGGKPGNFYSH